jgi:hypothetical protein
MKGLAWWMRIVGALYLFLFVAAAFLRLPIQAEGPPGVLELASSGEPVARFVVDTWVVLGLELGVIGAALLLASRAPAKSIVLVMTVIAGELVWGIGSDLYKLARGYPFPVSGPWIIVHSVVILTGLLALRKARSTAGGRPSLRRNEDTASQFS